MRFNWRRLNVNRRLNVIQSLIFGLIFFQITVIILSLFTFKTIRTFVSGESIWAKSHKESVINLMMYINSGEERYLINYEKNYQIQNNMRLGRIEILKDDTDLKKAIHHFNEAFVNQSDLDFAKYIFPMVAKYSWLQPMMDSWKRADDVTKDLHEIFLQIKQDYQKGNYYSSQKIQETQEKVYEIESYLFNRKNLFSSKLAGISRKIENFIGVFIICLTVTAFLTVMLIYSSLVKTLNKSLKAIKVSMNKVKSGDLNAEVDLAPREDIEDISKDLNSVYRSFKAELQGRIKAEEAEARLAVLGDAMPQMVCIKKANNEIEFINKKVWDYFGYKDLKPFEINIYENCHPEDYDQARMDYERSAIKKTTSVSEIRLKGKDGKYNWFLSRFEPVLDKEGNIFRWYGSYTDIQDQKNTSLELQKAVSVRDQFLSIASHELKTPLTSLKLQIDMRKIILNNKNFAKLTPAYFEKIVHNDDLQVKRLIHLVDEMLDISKIRSGKVQLTMEEFSFDEFMTDIAQRFLPEFEERKCNLKIKEIERVKVRWDLHKVEQVIVNLLTNALKYGNNSDVEIGIKKEANLVLFYVRDFGLGVPEEFQSKIFDLYERVNTGQAISGLGLGLFIVKQIVNEHKGRIYLESKEGEGSTFFVELPANL